MLPNSPIHNIHCTYMYACIIYMYFPYSDHRIELYTVIDGDPDFLYMPPGRDHMVRFNLTDAVFSKFGYKLDGISFLAFECGFVDGNSADLTDGRTLVVNIEESKQTLPAIYMCLHVHVCLSGWGHTQYMYMYTHTLTLTHTHTQHTHTHMYM